MRFSPVVFADPALPHQIVLRFDGRHIVVSCNCLRVRARGSGPGRWRPLGARVRWDDPGEPIALWRAHMAAVADERR